VTPTKLPHNLYKTCSGAKHYILLTVDENDEVQYAYKIEEMVIAQLSQVYFMLGLIRDKLENEFDF